MAAVAQAALLNFTNLPEWVTVILTIVAGGAAWTQVMPVKKLKDAGVSPTEVNRKIARISGSRDI